MRFTFMFKLLKDASLVEWNKAVFDLTSLLNIWFIYTDCNCTIHSKNGSTIPISNYVYRNTCVTYSPEYY